MAVAHGRHPALFAAGYFMNLAGLVIVLMTISAFAGVFVADGDIRRAQLYCDRLAVSIERHREETGRYPERLEEVERNDTRPRLLQGQTFYRRVGDDYIFEFRHPFREGAILSRTGAVSEWRECR
jgi:hypothetical protein